MRKLADMTPDEVAAYMQMLGEATRTVVPPDADFLVLVGTGTDGPSHFISSVKSRARIVSFLRGVADDVEAGRDARGVG
jgi:anthranilate phosphoribosyltransferase